MFVGWDIVVVILCIESSQTFMLQLIFSLILFFVRKITTKAVMLEYYYEIISLHE
jgi:hypothetical protein